MITVKNIPLSAEGVKDLLRSVNLPEATEFVYHAEETDGIKSKLLLCFRKGSDTILAEIAGCDLVVLKTVGKFK